MGDPVGNNHGSSCGTTGPGEDNLLFLLLFLRFGTEVLRVTQSGTSWHNARWNAGIRGLRNDFFFVENFRLWMDPFRSTGRPLKYNRFLHLSGSRFSLFLFLTPPRVVPNVWHFPYFVGATSTNSLMIKLQPKIYDHIMFTVRISFIPSVCSQVPVILIRLPEPRREASVETFTSNRRFFMVFPLITAALSTPPDIWCQIVARFPISFLIELAISVALIVQVREEGWTSRMRESGSIDKKEE
ncbi:hypothetical protein IEQ34_023615 [Dendrobium chrysotoxum]|uniref:MttB n=3 Tax=Dendrobium chrysotoxum TaxID=161865 RepID=A0AAV7FW51_DENCH|nr:hypothetical protein IEQ34_023615 [Dendrobium chrysotoxum]